MFAKISFSLFVVSALAGSSFAAPFNPQTQSLARRYISFNDWHGLSSLSGFDNFYGSENFSGEISTQVVEQEQEVVCHSLSVKIIQQKLLVLQEMAKQIITEQICDVETQTIVFQQYISASSHFTSDIMHTSGISAGYDSSIVSHHSDLYSSDGSLSTSDLGFSGSDVGKSVIVPTGTNWNDSTSPSSVQAAYAAAQSAISSN
ncbi:hypothetical protein F5879DRAFT_226174 [Lentinula edodes]|nr:hypothetical protein F5879DRAFT_226174 [Lentinula edodes]